MLIGIDPRFTAELLACLASLGHGDEIAIVDANFPAHSTAGYTQLHTPIELPGLDASQAIELITQLLPLDSFVPHCALRMEIDGRPNELGPVHVEAFNVLEQVKPAEAQIGSIERQAFYQRAQQCFAVIRTAERRPYGCFILRAGVVL